MSKLKHIHVAIPAYEVISIKGPSVSKSYLFRVLIPKIQSN